MKIKLLILFLFITSLSFSQITAGQTSNFDSGTDGWRHQNSNAYEPLQITTGGPAGVTDAFLRTTNSGTNGPGSKHAVINDDANWKGNYTSASIIAISFDIQNSGAADLHLRVAFNGTGFSDWAASSTAFVVPVGTSWTGLVIPVTASDLVVSQGTATVADILLNVNQIRIVSNDGTDVNTPLHKGQGIVLQSDYDNISAISVLNVTEEVYLSNEFTISPNPASSKLNLVVPNALRSAKISVFDVLGKKVLSKDLNTLKSSIDVSKWANGVYLVRVTNDKITQTKRFIKQ